MTQSDIFDGSATIGGFKVHPALAVFPMFGREAFESLVASIRELGLLEPIKLSYDRTTIVDGRNRLLACLAAQVEPGFERLGPHYTEAATLGFIVAKNLTRTFWTADERATILARAEAMSRDLEERR